MQIELEHFFDEFHGYDSSCFADNPPLKFNSMCVTSLIYDAIG